MPPNVSHGDVPDESSPRSSDRAVDALTAGRLPPSMYTSPARSTSAGAAVEVPGGVCGHDRSAERVAAEHDVAAEAPGGIDHVA